MARSTAAAAKRRKPNPTERRRDLCDAAIQLLADDGAKGLSPVSYTHLDVYKRQAMCFPLHKFSDIRYNYALAGGATMDAGCYAVHMARTFGGGTPEVVSAQAKLRDPQVDRAMTAELLFAEGHTGRVRCSMWSSDLLRISAKVVGEHGELRVLNPVLPQMFHRLSVRSADGKRVERFSRRPTYAYQLDAFAAAVLRGEPVKTTPADAIENMTVICLLYTSLQPNDVERDRKSVV